MNVSRPKVLVRTENDQKMEPVEEVTIDVDEEFSSTVVDSMNRRKAHMMDMRTAGRKNPHGVSRAVARPYRLSKPLSHANARHRRVEPRVSRLRAL